MTTNSSFTGRQLDLLDRLRDGAILAIWNNRAFLEFGDGSLAPAHLRTVRSLIRWGVITQVSPDRRDAILYASKRIPDYATIYERQKVVTR